MPRFALFLLGPPRIVRDGADVEAPRRKVVALLSYLAVTAQRHSRDELAELLYGSQDREQARANLRQTLSYLRSAVGACRLGADRLSVWFVDGDGLSIDVREHQRLLEIGHAAKARNDLSVACSQLAKAVKLYRGDFLSGFYLKDSYAFEEWQLMVQEGLQRKQAAALRQLVEIESDWGNYEQAIDYARQCLSLDQTEEALHRLLMELYGLAGSRSAALRQYEKCLSVLDLELGQQPDEETELLRSRIEANTLVPRDERRVHQTHSDTALPGEPDRCRAEAPSRGQHNLPSQPTRFIGREREVAYLEGVLRQEEVQLLTLCGPGGTGKTRLALQAAEGLREEFEQGVFFVDLAAFDAPDHLAVGIAVALGVREPGGDGQDAAELLTDYLVSKRILLILDNFEHVLSAAPTVAGLLSRCPRLKILTTTREALHLQTERVYQVPPMEIPTGRPGEKSAEQFDAVRLLAARVATVRSSFSLSAENVHVVAAICSRLDGLPLAIELAATRLNVLTERTLLRKLDSKLDLLTGGSRDLPRRQQTLRSEIDWSYELLTSAEQRIFARLSIFPTACTIDAAEAVCPDEQHVFACLSALAEKSLLILVDAEGESRFRMLETIRDYARERLEESGELDAAMLLSVDHFLCFSERAAGELYGGDQMEWLNRIDEEYENICESLSWLNAKAKHVDGLRLATALGWFWFRKGYFGDGQRWLLLFRDAAGDSAPPECRARAAYFLGWLKLCVGSAFWGNPEGRKFFAESLRLWRGARDLRGIAVSQVWLGWKDDVEGEAEWALVDESVAIARKAGDPWAIAWCLNFAHSHLKRPDISLDQKRLALDEAIVLARRTADPFLLSQILSGMGHVYSWSGEHEAAEPWYLESMKVARRIGDGWSILSSINCLADGYLALGRFGKAKELYTEGLALAQDLGARGFVAWFVGGFYRLARLEGRHRRAVRLGSFSESILNPPGRYDSRFANGLGLDEQEAAAEWRIGRAMSPEQAAAYALSDE